MSSSPFGMDDSTVIFHSLASTLRKRGHQITPSDASLVCSKSPHADICDEINRSEFREFLTGEWNRIRNDKIPYDIVHFDYASFLRLAAVYQEVPKVFTVHATVPDDEVKSVGESTTIPVVASSKACAEVWSQFNVEYIVPYGLDLLDYPAGDGSGDYCACIDSLTPENKVHVALDVARQAHVPIYLVGNPMASHVFYFEKEILPRLSRSVSPLWLKDVSRRTKIHILGRAQALLFPSQDKIPRLSVLEAMLVGTPVLAFASSKCAEMIEEGVTGYLVEDGREMAWRLQTIANFDRQACREYAQKKWNSRRMAIDYERVYQQVLRRRRRL